jgi:hypothetical protein
MAFREHGERFGMSLAALPVVSSTNQGPATMTIMLPTCPTALGREQRQDPGTVGDNGRLFSRRRGAPSGDPGPPPYPAADKFRIAPNDSAANGCRDGISSCPRSTPSSTRASRCQRPGGPQLRATLRGPRRRLLSRHGVCTQQSLRWIVSSVSAAARRWQYGSRLESSWLAASGFGNNGGDARGG